MDEINPELNQEDVILPEKLPTPTENEKEPIEAKMRVKSETDEDEIENTLQDLSLEDDKANGGSVSDGSDESRSESAEEIEDEDDASVILEREEGDGQESAPNRKVDDDEDKRNPQYIPKRGTFYEHDDRTAVDEETKNDQTEDAERTEKEASKKKVWTEKDGNKWSHDRFNDHDQSPKSRSELVSVYGYDIRNEEGPPRARRRRRYGRGPNKYTRNWEDEDAYNKLPTAPVRPSGRKTTRSTDEEFPPLGTEGRRNQSRSSERPETVASGDSEQNKVIGSSQDNVNRVNLSKNDEEPVPIFPQKTEQPDRNQNGDHRPQRNPSPKKEQRSVPRTNYSRPRTEEIPGNRGGMANARGVTRSRGFRSAGRGDSRIRNQKSQQPSEDNSEYVSSQNYTNRSINPPSVQDIEKEMPNLNLQDNNFNRGGKFNGPRQTSVPPRLQGEQRGSKRYSSLRQRSLPETAGTQNFGQQRAVLHYNTEYAQQNAQQQNQQGLLPHPTPTIVAQVSANSTQQMITVPPSQPMGPPIAHPVPTNGAPIMQAPPQYANPYPPPTFIQAGVAPAAFLPQQAPPPQIINFAPSPQFPQAGYSNFQHQQFAPVNQPQPSELYQPQGGITYYSTQNQQMMQRVPTKRPKAAIPIVPPPDLKEPRGRGRLNQGEDCTIGGHPDLQQENYELDNSVIQYGNDVIVQQ